MNVEKIRATSGRYRLVYVNKLTNKETVISCNPLSGEIIPPLKTKNKGLDLTTLDIYIIENFETEVALRSNLQHLGYLITDNDKMYIAYQHNGIIKYLDLVYGHEKLHDLAVLCRQYKNRFSNYAVKNNIASKEIRGLISREISCDQLWRDFYDNLIAYIHDPDFYSYLIKEMSLDNRTSAFIVSFLNNEACLDGEQREAFNSAKYCLIQTFTAYKSIRGVIVSRINYLKRLQDRADVKYFGTKQDTARRVSYFGYTDPFQLISNIQLWHLEDHPAFSQMSRVGQEDFILSLLGLKKVPWYERTIYPISAMEVKCLEENPDFATLTYLEKIRFTNKLFSKNVDTVEARDSYQKKRVMVWKDK